MATRKRTRGEYDFLPLKTYRSSRVRPRRSYLQSRPRAITVVPRTFGNARAVTERKYFDSTASGSVISVNSGWAGAETDPAAGTLFCPTEGNDINDRVGRKVTVLAIKIRGFIYDPPSTDATELNPIKLRYVLYQDMQSNAVQSQAEELLASPGVGTNQFQNTENFGRFRVLKDKEFTTPPRPITYAGVDGETIVLYSSAAMKTFKITHKFRKPVRVRFNATNAGTSGDIVDNSFHLIMGRSTTSRDVTYGYTCRVTYIDA